MESNQELSKKAVEMFLSGYNCTQSVLSILYRQMPTEEKTTLIPRIASGFGGGIGLCGSVCGSLTGTIMVVGIKYGSNEAGEGNNNKAYTKSWALFKQFEKQHGSVLCRELIKYDLSNPEELAKARQEGIFEKVCVRFVSSAVENLLKMEQEQV